MRTGIKLSSSSVDRESASNDETLPNRRKRTGVASTNTPPSQLNLSHALSHWQLGEKPVWERCSVYLTSVVC
jgi:hypothetical protein